jgi:hypothetical protein
MYLYCPSLITLSLFLLPQFKNKGYEVYVIAANDVFVMCASCLLSLPHTTGRLLTTRLLSALP